MASKDLRQKNRREDERRSSKRRVIPYAFGTAEWKKIIQEEYLLWPRYDRREHERRNQSRRQNLRRVNQRGQVRSAVKTSTLQGILSIEEKKMINELIQSDNSD